MGMNRGRSLTHSSEHTQSCRGARNQVLTYLAVFEIRETQDPIET